jgi:hypothetical protein
MGKHRISGRFLALQQPDFQLAADIFFLPWRNMCSIIFTKILPPKSLFSLLLGEFSNQHLL